MCFFSFVVNYSKRKVQAVGILLLLLLAHLPIFGQSYTYLEALPQKGQGVYSFLRSFGVHTACNESQFYTINGLRKKQGLSISRKYKLPILLYAYNGRSIRSTIGITDRPLAVRIQSFNEQMAKNNIKPADYRKDRILWVPYHLMACPQEDIGSIAPSGPVSFSQSQGNGPLRGIYDIFGPKYDRVRSLGNSLKGKVFYLVSGHGGSDPGAVGRYNRKDLCEDEYAYDITLRLGRNLISHGATVYFITRDPNDGIRSGEILPCDTDELCWEKQPIPTEQIERLFQRSNEINQLSERNKRVSYQRAVVIHIDSRSRKKSTDVFFYFQEGNSASTHLANGLQNILRKKYNEIRKGRGYHGSVSARDLHMLREVWPPSVFIELGNIKNASDQVRFVKERNRQLLADWLAEGLMRDALTK